MSLPLSCVFFKHSPEPLLADVISERVITSKLGFLVLARLLAVPPSHRHPILIIRILKETAERNQMHACAETC